MTKTMVRTLAVATVAAAGALATFGADTAVAGRTVSPFAGLYSGPAPDAWTDAIWGSISISSNGAIVGSQPPAGYDGKFNGSVKDDGTFEILGSWNPNKTRWWVTDFLPALVETSDSTAMSRARVGKNPLAAGVIHYIASSGTIVLGGDGNLYGTTSYGNSFVWTRK